MAQSAKRPEKRKVALITGVTGQDGAYLAEFLLKKGYEVHGLKRRTSLFNTDRIDHLYRDPHEKGVHFFLHHGDMTDSSSLTHIIQKVQPDEIYNLAAQSHVAVSFEEPESTANSDAIGALRILEPVSPQWAGVSERRQVDRAVANLALTGLGLDQRLRHPSPKAPSCANRKSRRQPRLARSLHRSQQGSMHKMPRSFQGRRRVCTH